MDGFGDMYGNDWIANPRDAFCVGVWSSQSTSNGTTGGTYACRRVPREALKPFSAPLPVSGGIL